MRRVLCVLLLGTALLGCDGSGRRDGDEPSVVSAQPNDSDGTEGTDGTEGNEGIEGIDARIPEVRFNGERVDGSAPYFGSQNPSGGAAEPTPGFQPAAADQEFCWAVAVINGRPQPRDEFEEVVVATQYFVAIQPFVPPALDDEFALLIEFTNAVVDAGSFTEADEIERGAGVEAVSVAVQTIDDFVDNQCLGLS